MTRQEREFMVGMFAGQTIATIHLSVLLAQNTGMSQEIMADSFRRIATSMIHEDRYRETISTYLEHIARGIEKFSTENEDYMEEIIKNVLH